MGTRVFDSDIVAVRINVASESGFPRVTQVAVHFQGANRGVTGAAVQFQPFARRRPRDCDRIPGNKLALGVIPVSAAVGQRQVQGDGVLAQAQIAGENVAMQSHHARNRRIHTERLFHPGKGDGARTCINGVRGERAAASCIRDNDGQMTRVGGIFNRQAVSTPGTAVNRAGDAAAGAQNETVDRAGCTGQVLEGGEGDRHRKVETSAADTEWDLVNFARVRSRDFPGRPNLIRTEQTVTSAAAPNHILEVQDSARDPGGRACRGVAQVDRHRRCISGIIESVGPGPAIHCARHSHAVVQFENIVPDVALEVRKPAK